MNVVSTCVYAACSLPDFLCGCCTIHRNICLYFCSGYLIWSSHGPPGMLLPQALSSSLFVPTSSTAPPSPNPGMLHRAGSGSTHLHGSSSASTLASAAAATASSHYAGLPTSLHAQLQQPLLQQPALHQLPPASSLGQQDQLSLALALDMGVGSGGAGGADPAAAAAAAAAARLLSSVLTTLGAMEQAHFTVRLVSAGFRV